jgi:transcription-repair coupling factor
LNTLFSCLSSREFFTHVAQTLPNKSSFSGVANSSAKLFLLNHLLHSSPVLSSAKNILFVPHEDTEVAEFTSLAPLFLNTKEYTLHTLPHKDTRDELKVEWVIRIAQLKEGNHKNIFLLSETDALAEKFPEQKKLLQEQLVLEKGGQIDHLGLFNRLVSMGFEVSPDLSLQKGQYRRSGEVIDVFPIGSEYPFKIEMEFDRISNIWSFSLRDKRIIKSYQKLVIFPIKISGFGKPFHEMLQKNDLIITDDVDAPFHESASQIGSKLLEFTPFAEGEDDQHHQMRFLSVLKFYNLYDLLSDFRSKLEKDYFIFVFTKRTDELQNIFLEEKIPFFTEESTDFHQQGKGIFLLNAESAEVMPPSFQNPDQKILFLTDREIFQLRRSRKQKSLESLNLEFLTSLKLGDYVVHMDHGIGHFLGVSEQEIDEYTREYLEIAYAGSDRLFVPVDQAEKVSRFLHEEGEEPKLNRLGSAEWENIQRKAKKETEKIAKELLKLYAEREQSKKLSFSLDTKRQQEFERTFPYEETPGQISSILDVKRDMESEAPMDRLVCGDVGFGKTEVAMRAAFKCVENGRQVTLVAPVTILAQQHYESFTKRMNAFDVRIEVISRFKTPAQQKQILKNLEKGKIDILIGTHRLLQPDVKFRNLGLLVIDEEQRFGVRQKERFKEIRKNVDVLTLTATPIPRTLNLALNKLRDISTITTPPPGRLPIITEVRRFSDYLIRDAICKELERGGQVYFLYNRVKTIEGIADKLRHLVPEAKVVVGHGQLQAFELEKRIIDFKEGKYNVLVSSTIVENGIDLPNANTIIVMHAECFGLAQLYQLRGRIGRGKRQAFAYFLYQTQKLSVEAKKRLRAIVEASELGSGFQIAMRDLEIRGAGDVLGVSQSGTVNAVGVGHFLRLLKETIRKMKEGKKRTSNEETKDVTIDLPVDAYIPSTYIADSKDKILAYQSLSSANSFQELKEIAEDFSEEYGKLPSQVSTLLRIIELKILARQANIIAIRSVLLNRTNREIQFLLGKNVGASEIMNLLQHQEKWLVSSDRLKIPLKELGRDFLESIKKGLLFLGKKGESKKKS